MSNESSRRVRLVFGIVLSVALVAAGVCLMTACLGIYLTGGDQIFTPQRVAEAFSVISVPVYLCLALILIGFLLDLFLPFKKNKLKAEKNPATILDRLLSKRDVDTCDPALKEQILALRKRRCLAKIITLAVLTVCSIAFLCYGANPANFHSSEINASMTKAVIILLVCMTVPFAFALVTAYRTKKSLEKEIELVKEIPVGESVLPVPKTSQPDLLVIARWALVAVAVAILVYGFCSGGTADVLTKAKNICTECVGLG